MRVYVPRGFVANALHTPPAAPRGPRGMLDESAFDDGMRYRVLERMRSVLIAPAMSGRSVLERIVAGDHPREDDWYRELREDTSDGVVRSWHLEESFSWEFWRLMGKAGYRPEVYFFMLPGVLLGVLLFFLQWISGALGGVPYVGAIVGYFQVVSMPIAVMTSMFGACVGAWIGWMRAYNKMFYQTIILDGGKRYLLAAFPLEFLVEHATLTASGDFLLVLPPKKCCVEAGGGDRCSCDFRKVYEEDYKLAKPAASTKGDPEASNRYLLVSLFGMVGRECTPLPDPKVNPLVRRAPALALVAALYVIAFFLLQS